MTRQFFWVFAVFMVVSCKKEKKENKDAGQEEKTELHISLPELRAFEGEKSEEINEWPQYVELNKAIRQFREEKGGDVVLQLDDLLKKEKELSDGDFPDKFDNPSVRSRLSVVKTYLLQTRMEAPDPVPEEYLMKQKLKILEAFNDFDRQLSVMMRGSITDEFLTEISNKPLAKRDSLKLDSVQVDSTGIKK
ncbi:hypothetical protein [Sinomicrobium sp. M5D2P17]